MQYCAFDLPRSKVCMPAGQLSFLGSSTGAALGSVPLGSVALGSLPLGLLPFGSIGGVARGLGGVAAGLVPLGSLLASTGALTGVVAGAGTEVEATWVAGVGVGAEAEVACELAGL